MMDWHTRLSNASVNARLSAAALIKITEILMRRLFGVRRLLKTSASQLYNVKRME